MKKITLVIAGALAGVILFQFLMYRCESRRQAGQIDELRAKLSECLTTPPTSDTVYINQVLRDTIYLRYTYRVVDTVRFNEGVIDWLEQTVEQREYTGSYQHPQFDLNWSALVTGSLDRMTINPPSLIKSMVITKTKTVDLSEPCDPVERSHLYANIGGTYFNQVGGLDVGLLWIHKRGFGVRAGIATDFERLGYTGGMVVRLK